MFEAVVLSVAVTATGNGLPACVVVVPVIAPVAVLMLSPVGRPFPYVAGPGPRRRSLALTRQHFV